VRRSPGQGRIGLDPAPNTSPVTRRPRTGVTSLDPPAQPQFGAPGAAAKSRSTG